MAAITERFSHELLHFEAQALLGSLGQEMQMTAHRPQEALAAAEAPIFVRREHAGLDKFSFGLVGIKMLGEPVQRVQVAQAAFTVLDVGLDEIAGGPGTGMTGVLLGELGLDEGPRAALEHLLAEAMMEIGIERLVAEDQARVEKRSADGHVRQAEAQALVDVAGGVADFEAQVPE